MKNTLIILAVIVGLITLVSQVDRYQRKAPAREATRLVDAWLTAEKLGHHDAIETHWRHTLLAPRLHSVVSWEIHKAVVTGPFVHFRLTIESANPVTGYPVRENWSVTAKHEVDGEWDLTLATKD